MIGHRHRRIRMTADSIFGQQNISQAGIQFSQQSIRSQRWHRISRYHVRDGETDTDKQIAYPFKRVQIHRLFEYRYKLHGYR